MCSHFVETVDVSVCMSDLTAVMRRRPRLSALSQSCINSTNPDVLRVSALHSSVGRLSNDRPPTSPLHSSTVNAPVNNDQLRKFYDRILNI